MLSVVGTNKVQKLILRKKKQLLLIWMSPQITQISHAVTSTSWSHFLILHSLPNIHPLFEHSCNNCMRPYMSKLAEPPLSTYPVVSHLLLYTHGPEAGSCDSESSSHHDIQLMSKLLCSFWGFFCGRIAKKGHERVSVTTWSQIFLLLGCWKAQLSLFISLYQCLVQKYSWHFNFYWHSCLFSKTAEYTNCEHLYENNHGNTNLGLCGC